MVHRWKEADVPVLQREGGSEEDVQQSVSFSFDQDVNVQQNHLWCFIFSESILSNKLPPIIEVIRFMEVRSSESFN